jgi:hypothetical protein
VQIGLIVNDVAKINIDSKLVRERTVGGIDTGDCVELQNGCACCNARFVAYFDMLCAIPSFVELLRGFGDFLWVVAIGFKLRPLDKLFLASVEFLLC